jgi:hypothetical protein
MIAKLVHQQGPVLLHLQKKGEKQKKCFNKE